MAEGGVDNQSGVCRANLDVEAKMVQNIDGELLTETKRILKSLVIPFKDGCSVGELASEYKAMENMDIPFRRFGHNTVYEFLASLTDIFVFQRNKKGDEVIFAVANEKDGHILSMVQEQRDVQSKPFVCPLNCVPRYMSQKPRKNKLVWPSDVKRNPFGNHKVNYDDLHFTHVRKNESRRGPSSNRIHDAFVPFDVRNNMITVLSKVPNGIQMCNFILLYESQCRPNEFNYDQMGFDTLRECLESIPDIVDVIEADFSPVVRLQKRKWAHIRRLSMASNSSSSSLEQYDSVEPESSLSSPLSIITSGNTDNSNQNGNCVSPCGGGDGEANDNENKNIDESKENVDTEGTTNGIGEDTAEDMKTTFSKLCLVPTCVMRKAAIESIFPQLAVPKKYQVERPEAKEEEDTVETDHLKLTTISSSSSESSSPTDFKPLPRSIKKLKDILKRRHKKPRPAFIFQNYEDVNFDAVFTEADKERFRSVLEKFPNGVFACKYYEEYSKSQGGLDMDPTVWGLKSPIEVFHALPEVFRVEKPRCQGGDYRLFDALSLDQEDS